MLALGPIKSWIRQIFFFIIDQIILGQGNGNLSLHSGWRAKGSQVSKS